MNVYINAVCTVKSMNDTEKQVIWPFSRVAFGGCLNNTVEPLYKETPKSNTTPNNNHME